MHTKTLIVSLLVVLVIGTGVIHHNQDLNSSNRLSKPLVRQESLFLSKQSPNYQEGQVLGSYHDNEKVERWRSLVKKYFPESEVDYALEIIHCESSGNPKAHNLNYNTYDNSYGLFQINLWGKLQYHRPSPQELVDPEKNIKFARELWDRCGWEAWGCH